MRKQHIALLCLLALLLALALPAIAAYEDIYLMGINDTVLLGFITAELMPVRRSGILYAPYSVLDNADLKLSYALNRTGGTFTIFNQDKTLIFYLNSSGSADKEGNSYTARVIARNGVVFIPLRFVASFFELSYSYYNLVLPEGAVPIARICTEKAALTDQQFGTSAAGLAAGPVRQYAESQAPAPSAAASAAPASQGPAPSAAPRPVDISFAVACVDGGGFQTVLESFALARRSALFLFSPDDLAARDDDVRAAAAAGHQVGLLLPAEEPEAAFAKGNELLRHILRCEATQVAFLQGGAKEGNWWVWNGNVYPKGGTSAAQAAALLDDVNALAAARVTVNDTRATAQALRQDMNTWRQRPYTILTPNEGWG